MPTDLSGTPLARALLALRERLAGLGLGGRLALVLLLITGLIGIGLLTRRDPTDDLVALFDGHRFAADDALRITTALQAKGLLARNDNGQVRVPTARVADALKLLDQAGLGLRTPEDYLDPPAATGLLPSPREIEQQQNRRREKYLESQIEGLQPGLASTVQIFRRRPRGLNLDEVVKISVILRVEGDRPVPSSTIEKIKVLLQGLEPDLTLANLSILDSNGNPYMLAGNETLGKWSRLRARVEDLREAVLAQLDWIEGVRVGISIEPPSAATSQPDASAVVSVNAPLEIDDEPAGPPSTGLGKVRIVVRVPDSYYAERARSVAANGKPEAADLELFARATEVSIRSAVSMVVPRHELAALVIDRIHATPPSEAPAHDAPPARTFAIGDWWLWAGIGLAMIVTFVSALASRWQESRRPTAAGAAGSPTRHTHLRPPAARPVREQVHELVRRDPAAAAGVLRRWLEPVEGATRA